MQHMHFYTAEHDLFFSADSNDINLELKKSLEYLYQAKSLSKSTVKPYVNHLIAGINELISLSESNKNVRKQDTLLHSLKNAINNLSEAESVTSPPTRLRLESIKQYKLQI